MRGRLWLAIGWSALILAACWLPSDLLFSLERKAAGNIELGRFNVDKLVHVAFFLGFGWLWCRALADWEPRKRAVTVLLGGLAFAFLSELGQIVPLVGRTMHLADFLADAAGLALGVWLDFRRDLCRLLQPSPEPAG
jgi:VanZ family protein